MDNSMKKDAQQGGNAGGQGDMSQGGDQKKDMHQGQKQDMGQGKGDMPKDQNHGRGETRTPMGNK
jgi:hypothetical protein